MTSHTIHFLSEQQVLNKQPAATSRSRLSELLLVALFISLGCQLWIRVHTVQQGYLLEERRTEVLKHDALLRELAVEYASLTRPAVFAARAQRELEMVALTPERVRRLLGGWNG